MAEDRTNVGHCGRQDRCTGADCPGGPAAQSAKPRLTAGNGQEEGRSTRSTTDPRSEHFAISL